MSENGYKDKVRAIIERARMGDVTMADRQLLSEALMRIAPADPIYREIVSVTGGGRFTEADDSQMPPGRQEPGVLQGPPTLDFLMGHGGHWGPGGQSDKGHPGDRPGPSTANNGLLDITPAKAHDIQGSAPIGSNTEVPQGPRGFEGPSTGLEARTSAIAGMPELDSYFSELSGDYSFSGTSPAMRDLIRQRPDVYANILYEDQPITQEVMSPYLESASALAETGMLGGGIPGNRTLSGGPNSPTMELAAIEDFMKQFDQPGMQFVDPAQVYGELFTRLEGTPTETMRNREGQQANIHEQIALSNQALFNAAPYLADSTREYLAARLEQAGVEYLTKLAKGETDQSYPAYLRSIGAHTWLTGE